MMCKKIGATRRPARLVRLQKTFPLYHVLIQLPSIFVAIDENK